MKTEIVPVNADIANIPAFADLVKQRTMNADEWIDRHGSGTLRKNKRIGMVWHPQYMEERIAFFFGWEFISVPRSRVTFGDAISEGDSSTVTEAGWFIDRYMALQCFPEDIIECKYAIVELSGSDKREGIAIIVRETSAQFVTSGHVVLAIVGEFDPVKQEWLHAQNPC